MGNDLVRFVDTVIERPTYVSGLSSGGVLSAWLSAYAKPGQVLAAHYEDPPLFASQVNPATGSGVRQGIGSVFHLWNTYLGDQWSIGDWDGMRAAAPDVLPPWLADLMTPPEEPPQILKEYDPEWGRAFWTGSVAASLRPRAHAPKRQGPGALHAPLPRGRRAGPAHGRDLRRPGRSGARALLEEAGVSVDYRSFETMGHSMHGQDPQLFTDTLVDWVATL